MPNKHASIKDLRKSKKRAAANALVKSNVKFHLQQAQQLLKKGDLEGAKQAAIKFQQAADKAAKRNVISKNKMNRKKGSIMKEIYAKKK